jgi:hypothetical protein
VALEAKIVLYRVQRTRSVPACYGKGFNIVAAPRGENPANNVCKMFEYNSTVSWHGRHIGLGLEGKYGHAC